MPKMPSTFSTIVTTEAGSSMSAVDKGKGKMVELSKEELKQKAKEEELKQRQIMGLYRQGQISANLEDTEHLNKIWSEDVIRSLAFGESSIFERIPKQSYDDCPEIGNQLDLPRTPILFRVKCFTVKPPTRITDEQYDEALIKFYSQVARDEDAVWSLKRIEKFNEIRKIDVFEGLFQNYQFKALRSDNQEYVFTLADLPIMNPSDLIWMLKRLLADIKIDVTHLLHHLRVMLQAYYMALAEHDLVLATKVNQQVDRPMVYRDGISKCIDGEIVQKPVWGVIFKAAQKNKKSVNVVMQMDERERFDNEFIVRMLKRINLCERNEDKEIKEVEKLLNWTLALHKDLLEVVELIIIRN